MLGQRHEPSFIALSDPKTLRAIALAFTALTPIYRADTKRELTEPELASERFTEAGMELLVVSKRRFEAALDTLQVTSLEQARLSLTLRQSPSINPRR